jgi:signal transduction histidine kinase
LEGKRFLDLVHPEDVERTLAAMADLAAEKEVLNFVNRYRCKDGSHRWIEWHSSPYQGRLIYAAARDITEQREMQERLIRQERLAVLGQLAGGVGHELRNPLGVISNAVYFLQMVVPDADETTATTREYLGIIAAEVRNAETIVSDLLDLSRTRPAEREAIAASDLIAAVLDRQPPPERVSVTTRMAPALPTVFVDPRQIGLVLTNLVTNAYQAMPDGGKLTIDAQAEEGQVRLSVTDTGCGIPQENMAKLFEPLFTTRARGIGLGLAVSKNLVEVNGGSIEVESEEGQGSTFTVTLPRKEEVS